MQTQLQTMVRTRGGLGSAPLSRNKCSKKKKEEGAAPGPDQGLHPSLPLSPLDTSDIHLYTQIQNTQERPRQQT
ncbi:hypothetical protein CWE24_01995 [Pseudidiomarina donghaiensis]|uniref:Uncharacterized protein n=1 Tax=Pseudidiomarina donghaiensis TaxID=519452 RepID=A0A432XKS8_9GAMM|nr:hypothetical protein CWE24_01995 [Pseudidiomarina donghaiensis]